MFGRPVDAPTQTATDENRCNKLRTEAEGDAESRGRLRLWFLPGVLLAGGVDPFAKSL
jgi:hypothetical protein